ncbi:DUF1653 domain-containing protein [Candidatus Saccharibacteria bacterium]|nr:DUF1653 domain-containing protein [Candidatus Saccharibacteria bacterium]
MAGVIVGRVYKHYKGDLYVVEGIAKHSETLEEMVIYRQLYGKGEFWARPIDLFIGEINKPGVKQKHRFELQNIKSKAGH